MESRINGTLKNWNAEKGFGFITPLNGGQDIFVHISDYPKQGGLPKVGEPISFEVILNKDGKLNVAEIVKKPEGEVVTAKIDETKPVEAKAEAKDIIYKGDAKCTSCHDENESVPVLSIAKTKHGVAKDGRVPTCVSCHGESETHANKPEAVKVRPATERNFGKKSKLTADEKSAVCTTCHQGGKHMNWNTKNTVD